MKNPRTAVMVLILVGMLSVPAQAQVIPGRWEKIEALMGEPPIIVNLKSGDRLEGQFGGLSASGIFLRTRSAQAAIPRVEIQQITTRQHDRRWNTTLIGAGIGAGIGGIVIARRPPASDPIALVATGAVAIGAGIGALVAYTADALIMEEVVLYQAP